MQKEFAEKPKKIPQLSKGASSSSDGNSVSGPEEGAKAQSSGIGSVQGSVPSANISAAVSAAAMPISFSSAVGTSSNLPASGVATIPNLTNLPNYEAVKRAQEFAAKMGFRQDPEFAPLINLFPGQLQVEVTLPQKPTKAPVLRLDALGREKDEHGNVVVTKPSNLSTLKVNIKKQKKDAFQILKTRIASGS